VFLRTIQLSAIYHLGYILIEYKSISKLHGKFPPGNWKVALCLSVTESSPGSYLYDFQLQSQALVPFLIGFKRGEFVLSCVQAL